MLHRFSVTLDLCAPQLPQRLSRLKRGLLTQAHDSHKSVCELQITERRKGSGRSILRDDTRENLKSLNLKRNASGDNRFSQNTPSRHLRYLTPYELTRRVVLSCQTGDLNRAISQVKEAPLNAQNAVVWANLLGPVMMAGKYQEGYRLFTEMKRRGIRPTSRTYGTLLKGYCQIQEWDKFSVQLDNVCSIYDQVKHYHAGIEHHGGVTGELSNIPYNQIISIFGKAQRFQRMFDVFNAMPSKGPLAPDLHTFTALLTGIGNRRLSALPAIPTGEGEEAESTLPSPHELAHKNASDAKLIWRQLLRVCQRPDSHAIRAVLKPLSRGRPSDQNFGLDIVHEYLGLARPGQQAVPPKLALHGLTLEAILEFCNRSRRYKFTLHYVQQVVDTGRGALLTRRHMDLAMEAHALLAAFVPGESTQAVETLQWMLRMQALPLAPGLDGGIGPQIKPEQTTYDLVALGCWYAGDWPNACRTFELMTSYSADEFRGSTRDRPMPQPHHSGQKLRPGAGFMSSFLRTAAKTFDLENIRQALNILEHYGLDTILGAGRAASGASPKQEVDRVFYASKLTEALAAALPPLLQSTDFDHATKRRWNDLLRNANEKLAEMRKSLPEVEDVVEDVGS